MSLDIYHGRSTSMLWVIFVVAFPMIGPSHLSNVRLATRRLRTSRTPRFQFSRDIAARSLER